MIGCVDRSEEASIDGSGEWFHMFSECEGPEQSRPSGRERRHKMVSSQVSCRYRWKLAV